MGVSKVIYNTENGAEVLMDLTGDTVTPDKLARGATAHGADGNLITGTATEVNVVQTTGTSTTDVMSQAAVTELIDQVPNIAYGTCETAAATAEKAIIVSDANWNLAVGSVVMVYFSASNSASNVKLNVNGTGAYPIWYNNAEYTSTGTAYTGYANRVIGYVFNGTHWVWIMQGYDSNTTYTNVKLGHGYATCTTAEATAAKVGTLASYTLTVGGIVAVKFTNAVPANATLNINSRGAKKIFYRGAAITAGVIKAGDIATFIYDGTQYQLMSIDRWQNDIDSLSKEIDDKQPKGNYALKSEIPSLTGYATEDYVDDKIAELPNNDALLENVAEKVPYVKVAEHPICVNSVAEMTDTSKMYVLNSDGMFYSYKTRTITTEGTKTPNFTNVMESSDAYVKAKSRYSSSGKAFKDCTTDDAIVIPITKGSHTIRVRGAGNNAAYKDSFYYGIDNQMFTFVPPAANVTRQVESNGDITISANYSAADVTHCVFHVEAGVDVNSLIVTVDQEITYTTTQGGTQTIAEWTNTGISYNQPANYESRVIAVENKTNELETETARLSNRLDNMSIVSGVSSDSIVFSLPAFAPTPQKAPTANGGGIMDVRAIRTNTYYEYMDNLVEKHPNYIYKQYMGKDMTNTFDHYRYIACRSFYHAWMLNNYPKMFAWKNGNTIIYSVSVSPRVGDTMYSTTYIGTSYGTVTTVNCNFDPVKASTRTVNGLEFERYSTADVEPTVVYTKVKREYEGCTVWNSSFGNLTTVSSVTDGVMTCANGKTYTRYPFEDRRNDKNKPLSVFIMANEHAGCNWGDSSIASIIVAQFLTDLCENKNIPFLRWLKDNCMITTIPIGNPWGYSEDSVAGYDNGNAVNINRNYDTPGWCLGEYDLGAGHGEYAGSENETQHIMNTIHLCDADVGMSMHCVGHHNETPMNDGYIQMQGNGFKSSIRNYIDEVMTTSYNLGLEGDTTIVNDPYHAGKSPSYIQWAGAVGGLTETIPWNALTGEYFDEVSMEAGYTEMLLFLQCWIKEALEKNS